MNKVPKFSKKPDFGVNTNKRNHLPSKGKTVIVWVGIGLVFRLHANVHVSEG